MSGIVGQKLQSVLVYVTSQCPLTSSKYPFGFAGFVTFVHCGEGGQRLAQIPPLK